MGTSSFSSAIDVDVHGSTVAILGATRDESGRWSPDGAIAFTGSLEDRLSSLKPITFSTDGKPLSIGRCGVFLIGGVRFRENGSLVVAPGLEPDVYLYDASHRLLRTWSTDEIDVLGSCPLGDDESRVLAADMNARMAWLNRHRIIDEVLDMPEGPALVIRSMEKGVVVWDLVQLGLNGRIAPPVRLPLRSSSEYARLRADRHRNDVAFLLQDHTPPDKPPHPARLIWARITP